MSQTPANNRKRATDLSKSLHWANLFITLLFIIILVANCQCYKSKSRYYGFCSTSSDPERVNGIYAELLILAVPACLFFYLIECWKSATRSYLKKGMEIKGYESFLKDLKASPPQIGTKIKCWHNEGTGEDRRSVTTHKGTSCWNYKSWKDDTGEIVGMNEGKMIKLEVLKSFTFANDASKEEFEAHNKDYIEKNKNRDTHFDASPVFEIGGYARHVLVQDDLAEMHRCMTGFWYWFWSLLMLSWPYRMWFEFMTLNKRIEIIKVVSGEKDQETIL